MGILNKLLLPGDAPPRDPDFKKLQELQRQGWDAFIEPENRRLIEFGIPVPTINTPLTIVTRIANYKYGPEKDPESHYPIYNIPPNLIIPVLQGVYFFLSGDNDTISKAEALLKKEGFSSLTQQFKGLWCTRDPYELYRPTSYVFSYGKILDAGAYHNRPDIHKHRVPNVELKTLSEFAEQHKMMVRRSSLAINLTQVSDLFTLSDGLPIPGDLYKTAKPATPVYDKISKEILELPIPDIDRENDPALHTWLKILPSRDTKLSACQEFLEQLYLTAKKVSTFGLIATARSAHFQVSCAPIDREHIERQIRNYFPDFAVIEIDPPSDPDQPIFIQNFLLNPPSGGIRVAYSFHLDPLTQLFALLEELSPTDSLSVYISFIPLPKQVLLTLQDQLRYSRYDCKEQSRALDQKLKTPPWLASIRMVASRPEILTRVYQQYIRQFETTETACKPYEVYSEQNPLKGFRPWNCLNTEELASFIHFPGKDVVCDLLETTSMKSKQPPALYTDSPGIRIGINEHRKELRTVVLPDSVRDRHCYIIGKTRMGKSTLITNLALQDIEAGRGVGVIDPHGDLVEDILERIPEHRVKDVIYFDAKDRDRPLALNPLSVQDEDEIEVLAADLNLTFRRLSESWGERMGSILRYVIHTLLRSRGVSFMDIQTILENPQFRERVVAKLPPGPIVNWWQTQFPNLTKDATTPILNRMSQFLLSTSIYNLLSQPDGKLNLFDVMQGEKVFLVNLSQGRLGNDNAHLLGSLIVSQIQQAAMRRASIPRSARYPFYLYIDEFQNFISSAFEKILSEAGKYQLCLTLAHQYISQLDDNTRNAIVGNVGTMILFQIAEKDANLLKAELGTFEPRDATDIEKYNAFCKPATKSSETFTLKTLPPPEKPPENFAESIIEQSKQQYSTHLKPGTQQPEPAEQGTESYEPPLQVETAAAPDRILRPRLATPKRFSSSRDRVLHYIAQAEYLSQQQIIELCFKDFYSTEASRKKEASTQLSELVEMGSLKKERFGPGNIFFPSGRKPNFSDHNLAVRDLYLKLVRSDFEISSIKFFYPNIIPGRSPDLFAEFASEASQPITTFWEYDTGSEFPNQLEKKLAGYRAAVYDRLTFVVETEERLLQLKRILKAPRLWFAVLGDFQTLQDALFYPSDSDVPQAFFSNIE